MKRKPQTDPVAAKMLDELLVLYGYRQDSLAVREALDYIARARHEHAGMVTTLGIANYLKELGKDGKEPLDLKVLRESLNLPPRRTTGGRQMTYKEKFILLGEAYNQLSNNYTKALRNPSADRALIQMVQDLDCMGMVFSTQHEGKTLAQHLHDAKSGVGEIEGGK